MHNWFYAVFVCIGIVSRNEPHENHRSENKNHRKNWPMEVRFIDMAVEEKKGRAGREGGSLQDDSEGEIDSDNDDDGWEMIATSTASRHVHSVLYFTRSMARVHQVPPPRQSAPSTTRHPPLPGWHSR